MSCTPFCLQNSLNLSGYGLYKVSKAFYMDAGPCWLHTYHSWVKLGGCPSGSGPFLIQMVNFWAWKTLHRCRSWHKPVCLAPTTISRSKALTSFVLHTCTIHVSIISRLKNPSLTCLLPFIYTDWSGFNRLRQEKNIAFTWIHLIILCNMLYTQCILYPQEVGGTLIGEDRLVVIAGAEIGRMVSNTSNVWFPCVWCHSIHSVPDIIMSCPPLSSLYWFEV